jgi:glucosamine-6-phosphate deaminase
MEQKDHTETRETNTIHPDDAFVSRFERIPVRVFDNTASGSRVVAERIAQLISSRQAEEKMAVLALSTGNSPVKVYQELVRIHREDGLSFRNVVSFNLDEYYGISPEHPQSYYNFMYEHLFRHIDMSPENIHIPEGNLPPDEVRKSCMDYETMIRQAGGIDIQLLGIGRNGHIGFNEPGSPINTTTRLVALDPQTRQVASEAFGGEQHVPRFAITMGVSTILAAKEIILIAWGESKAGAVREAVESPLSETNPASFLQTHPNVVFILDNAASSELSRIKTPWLLTSCLWDERLVRKAVLWLCQKVGKPILKITEQDYNDNGLRDLLTQYGPFSRINIDVFNDLQHTITGWPGGKPNVDDSTRPERALPYPKKVVIFSPHPDDDVISMGGTFARLIQQGHEVHVAYQTSGSNAVSDDEALKYIDFVRNYGDIFQVEEQGAGLLYRELSDAKAAVKGDRSFLLKLTSLKAAIRKGEARSSCRFIGLPESNIHFLDLPFYGTGESTRRTAGDADIRTIVDFLRKLEPHQIYAAGDLSDPHGTHRICLDIILGALQQMLADPWLTNCRIWLYRGAWQEWDLDMVDMAVPLSPEELEIKRNAIFRHQSQKDGAMFMGTDRREFWQRAEERNRNTARMYDALGMAEYEAIEVFRRMSPSGF